MRSSVSVPRKERIAVLDDLRAPPPHSAPDRWYVSCLALLLEELPGRRHGGHGTGPAGVEGQVGDRLDQLVDGQAVVDRPLHVAGHLVGAVEGDQGGNGDEAAVPFGKPGPFPDVPEKEIAGERNELGGEAAEQLMGASWSFRHVVLLGCTWGVWKVG